MKTLVVALVLCALAQPVQPPTTTPAPGRPLMLPSQQQTRSTGVASPAQRPRATSAGPARGGIAQNIWEQACETVLVVPTPELTNENLAQIAEDMTVMCRILDKAVAPSVAPPRVARATTGATDFVALLGSEDESRAQGLYLGGYGALFFLQVDFPLRAAAPQPEVAPAPEGPPADPVWSQTVAELQGAPAARPGAPARAQPYDAAKVENLKTALLKSLRHAANLRLTSAQDFITLVVSPRDTQLPLSYDLLDARGYVARSAFDLAQAAPDVNTEAQAEPANTLVLRVRKTEADALAQGQLTLEEFPAKVQILWSSAHPGTGEPGAPTRAVPTLRKR